MPRPVTGGGFGPTIQSSSDVQSAMNRLGRSSHRRCVVPCHRQNIKHESASLIGIIMKLNLRLVTSLLFEGLSGTIVLKTSAQTSVVNGDFESGFGGVDAIWTQAGTQPPPRTTADAHGGSYCMDLSITNADLTANTSEIDQNTFNSGGGAVTPGESYTFSFWAKQISSGVSYVQFYKVSFLDTNGAIVLDPGFTMFNGGNGVWSQITRTNLVAPANA